MADGVIPPEGISSRAPTPDDLEAVVATVAASELVTTGVTDLTVDDLRSDWRRPSFDLARDAVVALDGDRVAAYAELFMGRAWVHVHPDLRGRGIGSALLDWSEERARAVGADRIGQTVSDRNRAAIALLGSHGYSVRWTTWVFELPLDEEPPEPALPDEITLRSFEPGRDDRPTYELIDAAFSDWSDRDASFAFEDWAASFVRREDFDPELTLLLEDAGELVGLSLGRVYGDEGWVDQIAVRRDHRGRGLGKALLRASFRRFRERGLRTAGLSTESRTGARGVYEHVGMRVTRSFARYSKDL
jgi:mycothiol synthase